MGDAIERLITWCREHPGWELTVHHMRAGQRFQLTLGLHCGSWEKLANEMYHADELRLMTPCCQKLAADLVEAAERHIEQEGSR